MFRRTDRPIGVERRLIPRLGPTRRLDSQASARPCQRVGESVANSRGLPWLRLADGGYPGDSGRRSRAIAHRGRVEIQETQRDDVSLLLNDEAGSGIAMAQRITASLKHWAMSTSSFPNPSDGTSQRVYRDAHFQQQNYSYCPSRSGKPPTDVLDPA